MGEKVDGGRDTPVLNVTNLVQNLHVKIIKLKIKSKSKVIAN